MASFNTHVSEAEVTIGLITALYNFSFDTQTSLPPVGFEPTISAGERPQTYVLDRAATGTGSIDKL